LIYKIMNHTCAHILNWILWTIMFLPHQ
jgi:hypothetical protein